MGTLPRNVIPNATSVAIPSRNASATNHQLGVLHRVPEHDRVADPAEEHAHAHQRADRHQQAAGLDPVEAPQLRSLGARRLPRRRRGAPRAGRRAGRGRRGRRGSSPRAPAAGAPAARRPTVSFPRTRTAAATARSTPRWRRSRRGAGRRRRRSGGTARCSTRSRSPTTRGAVPSTSTCLPSSLPCGARAPRAGCAARVQHASSSRVAHRVGVAGRRARCPPTCSTTSSASEPWVPATTTRGVATPASRASSVEVRLVLHLRTPASGTSVGGASRYAR